MTFDDHLRAAQAKEPASMHELASLLAFEKSEMTVALVPIARGDTDLGLPLSGIKARQIARRSLLKLRVAW